MIRPSDIQILRGCALLNAASARAMIRAIGMQAENQMRELRGESPSYTESAFLNVIEEEGIHHNTAIAVTSPHCG